MTNPWVGPWQDRLSGTQEGRQGLYRQYMAGPQFNMYSPFARNILQDRDRALQGRYMLAAAPTSIGGYGDLGSYSDFIKSPLQFTAPEASPGVYQPWAAGTGYRQPDATELAGGFTPWTSGQWRSALGRIGELASENLWGQSVSGPAYDYLSTITPGETRDIMSGAMMAGRNPIMRRAIQPSISRAIDQWQAANPEMAAGEMLRQFASQYSTNPGYMPRVNDMGQFAAWTAPAPPPPPPPPGQVMGEQGWVPGASTTGDITMPVNAAVTPWGTTPAGTPAPEGFNPLEDEFYQG